MAGDVTKYLNLIPSANADKPDFSTMIAAVTQAWADVASVYGSIPGLYDLDVAVGTQLDVIGQWVGVSRQLTSPLTGVYFAFDTAGVGFDSGVWLGPYDPVTGLTSLPDDYYRMVIKMKILNNHWDGSVPGAYEIAAVVFGALGYSIYIEDPCNLTMRIGLIGISVPPALVAAMFTGGLLQVKPAGVRVSEYFYQTVPGPLFGFDLNNSTISGFDTGGWAAVVSN